MMQLKVGMFMLAILKSKMQIVSSFNVKQYDWTNIHYCAAILTHVACIKISLL